MLCTVPTCRVHAPRQPSVEVKPGYDAYGHVGFHVCVDHEIFTTLLYRAMADAEVARLRVDLLDGFHSHFHKPAR